MISALISRVVILLFGTLYPAYASYKAVRTKDVKEYVKWMMYWIVFALFTCAETFTDIFFSFWFPLYYETKIILVLYLLSPATRGSSILYRKFVHPVLIKHEQEIDEYISRAKEQGYSTVRTLGSKGFNYATNILMQTAIKGGGGLVNHIRKSYSLVDLPTDPRLQGENDAVDLYLDGGGMRRRGHSPRRSASSGGQVDMFFNEVPLRHSPISDQFQPSQLRSSEDLTEIDESSPRTERKDRLVRTSSVSSTARVRTRAAAKAERTPSLAEEWGDASEEVVVESQQAPVDGKVQPSLVSPHVQFLFSNLTPQELMNLVHSATAATPSPPNPGNEFKDAIGSDSNEPISSSTFLGDIVFPIDNTNQLLIDSDSASHVESVADGEGAVNSITSAALYGGDVEAVGRAVRRNKKKRAPMPPMGGSLIDLNRISSVSDHLEVSSVLDFDSSVSTPRSSPTPSSSRLGSDSKKESSNISKMFNFPVSFWHKEKAMKNKEVGDGAGFDKTMQSCDSFVSLHEDVIPGCRSNSPKSLHYREMSQSPKSKRRHNK